MSRLFTFTDAVFCPWFVNKLHEMHPTAGLDWYPFVGKTDVGSPSHSLALVCRFLVIAPKEQCILCQMVSSEVKFKNLRHDCADSAVALLQGMPLQSDGEGHALLPQGLVALKSWLAGLQAQFQGFFPEMLLQWNAFTSKLGQAWQKRSVHYILAFPNTLGVVLGKSVLSLAQSHVLPSS